MAGGGRIGGQGKLWQRAVWVFIACCIVVAVWNSFPHDPKGFYKELGVKSEQLKGVAIDAGDWLTGGFLGDDSKDSVKPEKSEPSKKPPVKDPKGQPKNK